MLDQPSVLLGGAKHVRNARGSYISEGCFSDGCLRAKKYACIRRVHIVGRVRKWEGLKVCTV